MHRFRIAARTILTLLFATLGASATADSNQGDNSRKLRTDLKGFEEIPTLSTPASGEFEAKISRDGTSVDYKLTYRDLEGEVTQAHIHLGAKAFNGGIMVFLCSNLTDPAPPPGTQACPIPSGTVEGTFTAADVIGPDGQGIAPGEFAEVIRAMKAGATYANVHSSTRQGGEIRGQIGKNDND
jgi:CHRD domain